MLNGSSTHALLVRFRLRLSTVHSWSLSKKDPYAEQKQSVAVFLLVKKKPVLPVTSQHYVHERPHTDHPQIGNDLNASPEFPSRGGQDRR